MEEEIIRGRDAQRHIVEIAQEVSSRVRKTLGPLGFDMMLVDRMGEHTQTNDGATIMKMHVHVFDQFGRTMARLSFRNIFR